uniref:Uncharacterized protein n=1 Tax=uncultured bacterium contig00019 TaxID=1181510 RepID=A0A806K041_9BACT|nr:hypothetical protein [uncultured bacterium contig00019]
MTKILSFFVILAKFGGICAFFAAVAYSKTNLIPYRIRN